MEEITIYGTTWCPDCHRAKSFLKERGVPYVEINIEEDESAEAIVIRANNGKRKIPTIKVGDRFFSVSPFNAQYLADELHIPLNK